MALPQPGKRLIPGDKTGKRGSEMSLKHAILAMLDIEQGSGYDLTKRFEQSVGFFWPASFQQVYRELGKLEEQQLVTAITVPQESKPDKKVYNITTEGIAALQRWQAEPAKAMKIRDTFLVKLFGGRRAEQDTLLEDLRAQRQQHEDNLQRYRDIAASLQQLAPELQKKYLLPYQSLELGIRFEQTWLQWCDDLENNWSQLGAAFVGEGD